MKFLPTVFFTLLLCGGLNAQSGFFSPETSKSLPAPVETTKNIDKMSIQRVNEPALRAYLLDAPVEFENNKRTLALDVPLPDGRVETFGLVESSLLSPEIAAQHPEIKSYTGNGLTHTDAVIRITFTSAGFHAVILQYEGTQVYFEHYSDEDKDLYYNYFTRDAISPPDFSGDRCGTKNSEPEHEGPVESTSSLIKNNTGASLRTFRLAMATTGEFTAQNGGTVSSAFAKVMEYVATTNMIYRMELSVNFTLVSGTNLVYTDASSDPYTNSDGSTMLAENQTTCDNVIGNANYDIGFVLGYSGPNSGGGIAASSSVCDNFSKAQGVGRVGGGPYGQVFFDQLVVHEIGHQFGMNHSYNSVIPVCTTRNPGTSVEPGAGATIMSYGFTCQGDDYFSSTTSGPILNFHTANYDEAVAVIGNVSCQTSAATGNTPPVVTMPSAVTIPKSTPFTLTGSADTPGSGDNYTFSWEGTNVGTMVPDASTLDDTSQPPFFRSYAPSASGASRTFPILSAILDGTNQAKGDKLPSVGVAANLRLTVRDNNSAGGGLSYGNVTVTVDGNIGPFLETTNLAGSYNAGSAQTITWSVNGTDAATSNVNILLSTDGGMTFPTTLAANTANDGSESIMLPNIQTTTARIKIEAVGNVFFDISNSNFTIAIQGCTASSSSICPANAVTFPQNDAGLNLTMDKSFGTAVSNNTFNVTDQSPRGELANAMNQGGTQCNTSWGEEAYEVFDFSVSATGAYSFNSPSANSIFLAAGYNPAMPCSGTFIGSNTAGALSTRNSYTVQLMECTNYKMVVWTVNNDFGMKIVSFSGAGSVIPTVATPANSGYTYVAVNNANGQIAAQSTTADFTSLTPGTYIVQGASYKTGGAASPANSNPSSWIGQTVAAVTSSECVVVSTNTRMVTVTGALPVDLLSFTGTINGKVNQLNWETTAEIDLDHYEVQRSRAGNNFQPIGGVSPVSDDQGGQRNYAFDDLSPLSGTNYYRLKIIDLDGTFEFSPIISLFNGDVADAFTLYPNPVREELNFNGLPEGAHTVNVRDVLGRVMMTQPVIGSEPLDVGRLPGGTYFLEIHSTDDEENIVKRFVKK